MSVLARILIRRGNMDDARNVMAKIYAYAKPEEVDLKVRVWLCTRSMLHGDSLNFTKVKVLRAAVQRSIEITNTTTFLDRCKSMMFNPVNRRALSAYLHPFRRWHGPPDCFSRRMWDASVSAIVWFQYPHVLFRDPL
jgi:hypothetical protein